MQQCVDSNVTQNHTHAIRKSLLKLGTCATDNPKHAPTTCPCMVYMSGEGHVLLLLFATHRTRKRSNVQVQDTKEPAIVHMAEGTRTQPSGTRPSSFIPRVAQPENKASLSTHNTHFCQQPKRSRGRFCTTEPHKRPCFLTLCPGKPILTRFSNPQSYNGKQHLARQV